MLLLPKNPTLAEKDSLNKMLPGKPKNTHIPLPVNNMFQ